jgi:hypothetical protein
LTNFIFFSFYYLNLDRGLDKTANKIESGGQAVGKGIMKGAGFIGKGIKG